MATLKTDAVARDHYDATETEFLGQVVDADFARQLETQVQELRNALINALTPLDMYAAYGWSDQAKVRDSARAVLDRTK